MKTGIELIIEQRERHFELGRTTEKDVKYNDMEQLKDAACCLIQEDYKLTTDRDYAPIGWDKEIFHKMWKKAEIERLAIAGSLIAAEIDRLQMIKEAKMTNENNSNK